MAGKRREWPIELRIEFLFFAQLLKEKLNVSLLNIFYTLVAGVIPQGGMKILFKRRGEAHRPYRSHLQSTD